MKTAIAATLLIVGTLTMVGGFAWAVWELGLLYKSTLNDSMTDSTDPKTTSNAMLTAAGVGIAGFVPATVGSIMLGKGLIGLVTRRLAAPTRR